MHDQIENNFTYHSPKPHQIPLYTDLRAAGKSLAHLVDKSCPPCREKSLAITKLEDTNAAIARGDK